MYQGGSEPRVDSLHPPWSGGRAGPIAWPAGMEPWRRRQRARLPGALPQNALNNTVPSTRTRAAAPTPRHARTQRSRPASPHLGYPQSRPLQLCRVRPWSPHAGTPRVPSPLVLAHSDSGAGSHGLRSRAGALSCGAPAFSSSDEGAGPPGAAGAGGLTPPRPRMSQPSRSARNRWSPYSPARGLCSLSA